MVSWFLPDTSFPSLKPWGRGCYVRIHSGSIFSASWSWTLESQRFLSLDFFDAFFSHHAESYQWEFQNLISWLWCQCRCLDGNSVRIDVRNKGAYLWWNMKSVGNYWLGQVSISWFQVSHWRDVRATCIERSLHPIFSSHTFIGNGQFHTSQCKIFAYSTWIRLT